VEREALDELAKRDAATLREVSAYLERWRRGRSDVRAADESASDEADSESYPTASRAGDRLGDGDRRDRVRLLSVARGATRSDQKPSGGPDVAVLQQPPAPRRRRPTPSSSNRSRDDYRAGHRRRPARTRARRRLRIPQSRSSDSRASCRRPVHDVRRRRRIGHGPGTGRSRVNAGSSVLPVIDGGTGIELRWSTVDGEFVIGESRTGIVTDGGFCY